MYKIDRNLISVYKSLLIQKLKNINEWDSQYYNGKVKASCYPISGNTKLKFELEDGVVNILESSTDLYKFDYLNHPFLYFYILKFKNKVKYEKDNRIIRIREKKLKDALPIEYVRSMKINKIIKNGK